MATRAAGACHSAAKAVRQAGRLCADRAVRSEHRGYSTFSSSASRPPASSPARLRFAPSPTGYLHLGGLRTALFNHLYARALGGKWILRIEDTDQTRLVPGSVAALQETLEWAKLDYDEGPSSGGSRGPYIQSERLELYRHYAERLIQRGHAYRDFRTEVVRENVDVHAPRTKHQSLRESYLPPSEAEAKHLISLGKPYVVRLHAETGALSHTDLVYGTITFPPDPNRESIDDPILLKSNGWPTYHLANVVDDHEMGITHVLRGEEWLPSLPKHIWLYRALGLTPPHFAHLPLLVNSDGSKLSKRTGDVRVENYRDRGFEPEALNNFLGLMGYNNIAYHQSKQSGNLAQASKNREQDPTAFDVLTMSEMIQGFDISHVNRSRATVDLSKLYYLNSRHIMLKLEDKQGGGRREVIEKMRPKLVEAYPELAERFGDEQMMDDVVALAKGTSATVYDISASAEPLFRRPDLGDSAAQKLFGGSALIHVHFVAAVREAHAQLARIERPEAWTKEALHRIIAQLPAALAHAAAADDASAKKIKKAAILAPLRFAVTAKERGPPLADLLHFLGQHESLHRLHLALEAHRAGRLGPGP